MLHACIARFDVIGNLENFLNFGMTKQGPGKNWLAEWSTCAGIFVPKSDLVPCDGRSSRTYRVALFTHRLSILILKS